MSSSVFRRHRRANGNAPQPKGSQLVKIGTDNNTGRTIYYDTTVRKKVDRLPRAKGVAKVLLPNHVFQSFRKPQERGALKYETVIKQADQARKERIAS